jgi:CheY-like chemotaxis protein
MEGSPLRSLNVLVVDDDECNRELTRLILDGAGIAIEEAQDGLVAVEAAGRRPFDVILMDLRMPNLDGLSAARRIRTEPGPNAATPILAFTADGRSDFGADAWVFDGAVQKPFEPYVLVGALRSAIARPPRAAVGT